ncbi:MAG: glycosyltransferase [Syntrophomonas sp.]
MTKAVIFGIDNFSRKNIKQIEYMNQNDIFFDIFTNDSLGDSQLNIPNGNIIHILKPSMLSRFQQVLCYLLSEKRNLAHVEVYPGGRFSLIYVILSKLIGKKVILVERGDLIAFNTYSRLLQFSAKWSYKLANIVWYREFYMKDILENMKVKKTFFLPNCVKIPSTINTGFDRRYDFLWVNRLIPQRKSDWFIDALNEQEFRNTCNAILGFFDFTQDNSILERQLYAKNNKPDNLIIQSYINPTDYFLHSKFFVLPSDIVFCNNSLIEAMSYGVVPLVSDVEGARLIVDDGVNGFVFEHSSKGLRTAMTKALCLSQQQYEEMSYNAMGKVKNEYDCEMWGQKLLGLYQNI